MAESSGDHGKGSGEAYNLGGISAPGAVARNIYNNDLITSFTQLKGLIVENVGSTSGAGDIVLQIPPLVNSGITQLINHTPSGSVIIKPSGVFSTISYGDGWVVGTDSGRFSITNLGDHKAACHYRIAAIGIRTT